MSDHSLKPSVENDRDLRGDRFAPVVIQARAGATSTFARDITIASDTDAFGIARKLRWTCPLPIPGSENSVQADPTSAQTAAVSGEILVYVRGQHLTANIDVRNINRSTNDTASVVIGSTYGWEEGSLYYPPQTRPGDILEIDVDVIATTDANAGVYGGLIVLQPPCTGYQP
jgi:hypothetical protein